MKVTFLEQACITSELKKLMKTFDEFYWAVAWGTENKLVTDLVADKSKIKRLIFGTHFYQSDPNLLERFIGEKFARIMPNDAAGTFHPKVYLFIKGNKAAAIVGSANFTNGAMNKNNEAAVLLEGDSNDETMVGIKAMVTDVWSQGDVIDQEFLDNYRLHYQATASHRKALERQRKNIKPSMDSANKGLLKWSWGEYAKKVRDDRFGAYEGRIKLLQEAHEIFYRISSFSELEKIERRAIAGLLTDGDIILDGGVGNWGWFGSMRGMGDFQNLINTNNKPISDALNKIPLSGEVTKAQFDEYIALFEKAFVGKARKGGVPTASRLLAMKRPDTFVCIDKQNKIGLSKDLGFAHSTLNFEKYWDQVIMPITESVWWQSPRPNGKDGLLWDGRAAMLDSIYYEGNH